MAPSQYLNQFWNTVNGTLGYKLQWNLNQNLYIVIQENASENVVCKMAAILSRPQSVNTGKPRDDHVQHWTGSSFIPIKSWSLFDAVILYSSIIKTHMRGFFDTDRHQVSWHFATHEAVRQSGF